MSSYKKETVNLLEELIAQLFIEDMNGDWNSITGDIVNGKYTTQDLINQLRRTVCNWIIEGSSETGSYVPDYRHIIQLINEVENSL